MASGEKRKLTSPPAGWYGDSFLPSRGTAGRWPSRHFSLWNRLRTSFDLILNERGKMADIPGGATYCGRYRS